MVRMWMFRAPKRSLHTVYGHQQPADGAVAVQDAEEPEGLDGVIWKGGAEVVVAVSSAEASFRSLLQGHGSLGS